MYFVCRRYAPTLRIGIPIQDIVLLGGRVLPLIVHVHMYTDHIDLRRGNVGVHFVFPLPRMMFSD